MPAQIGVVTPERELLKCLYGVCIGQVCSGQVEALAVARPESLVLLLILPIRLHAVRLMEKLLRLRVQWLLLRVQRRQRRLLILVVVVVVLLLLVLLLLVVVLLTIWKGILRQLCRMLQMPHLLPAAHILKSALVLRLRHVRIQLHVVILAPIRVHCRKRAHRWYAVLQHARRTRSIYSILMLLEGRLKLLEWSLMMLSEGSLLVLHLLQGRYLPWQGCLLL